MQIARKRAPKIQTENPKSCQSLTVKHHLRYIYIYRMYLQRLNSFLLTTSKIPTRRFTCHCTNINSSIERILSSYKAHRPSIYHSNSYGKTMSTSQKDQTIHAKHDLSDMRRPYRDQDDGIEESKLPTHNPVSLFENWFELAKLSKTVYEPNAFCISTCGSSGQPTSRMVLLKGFDETGFQFFTHYSSQKGRDIEHNPKVAMLFYWDSFNRQIRIEGIAQKMPEEVGENYFKRRPQSSQVGAAISDQKSLIESRQALMDKYDRLKAELGDESPPKPPTWGGYLVVPNRFEFWQGNTNRVHDRIIFRRKLNDEEKLDPKLTKEVNDGWLMERLLP